MNKEACSGEKERLIDGVIRSRCFFCDNALEVFCGFCGRGKY